MANNFFAGFDVFGYPADTVMTRIIQNTNLRWCGFYLAPAPSQWNTSWMTKRAFLQGLGWGLAPIYVGQQVSGPGSHKVTAAQGTLDAQNAASLANKAGFAKGSIIFLDIEQGPPAQAATLAYYGAWVTELVAHTNYAPGVYCSFSQVAQALFNADSRPVFWVFNINKFTCDPTQVKPGRPLIPRTSPFPAPNPTSSGVSFAQLWQLAQGSQCGINAGGSSLAPVDFDSSVALDPSNPATYPGHGTGPTGSTGHIRMSGFAQPYEFPPSYQPQAAPEVLRPQGVPLLPCPSNTVAIVGVVGMVAVMGMVATAGMVATVAISNEKG